jgi:hypothetical protein
MKRTTISRCLFALLCLVAVQSGIAQEISEMPPPEMAAMVAQANEIASRGGGGPFPAEMTSDTGLPGQTIYKPRDLAAASADGGLPIIAWGNGACANYGNRFRYFLTEIASRGYVIFAIGPIGPDWLEWNSQLPGDPNVRPEDRPAPSHASQMNAAIDWAIAENVRPGSRYYGRLDPERVAVMGMSCGGLQAIAAAADPRVKTLVVWNSGTFPEGTGPLAGTGEATKASLPALHTTVAYISGDESDIAFDNANDDYDAINHVPIFRAWQKGVGHGGTYREPAGGAFTAVAIAWLEWQLRDDENAGAMFSGEDCTLCLADDWVVMRKGW